MNPAPLRAPPRRLSSWTFAAALAGLLAACSPAPDAAGGGQGGPGGPGGAPPPMPVSVIPVRVQTVPQVIEAVGTLEGVREVEVRARIGGVLLKQHFREGEPVRAGTLLFQIERAPYEVAVAAARAVVAQQEALLEQARRENTRLAGLIAERAISQRDADTAASTLKTAEAGLLAARAQLREAELNLGYTQVSAPIAGLAQRAQRSEGALVSPADPTPLTTLVQTNPIRVRFALADAEAQALRRAGRPAVRLLGPDGQPLGAPGRLDFAGAVVDPRLGTVAMRAELPNGDGAWLPGQFVRVHVSAGTQQGVLVPQSAVMSGDQGRFVWVVGADGTAQPRPVQTGAWQGSDWVLREGLVAGDRVIVDNLMKLRPGAPVQAKEATATATAASAPAPAAASAPASGAGS